MNTRFIGRKRAQVQERAFQRLTLYERELIERQADALMMEMHMIDKAKQRKSNFGEASSIELVCALGIFMNKVGL
jgi:hypothetical protein